MKKHSIDIFQAVFSILLALGVACPGFAFAAGVKTEVERPEKTVNQTAPIVKHALLVGISEYDRKSKTPNSDWWNLYSANDVELIADVLIRKFEFRPENIRILSDKPVTLDGQIVPPVKPTKALIIETFRSFLIARAKPGNVVYFHFSGHGQWVPDDNGDEIDGRDETLVPIDYVSQKEGSRNIRDDEIGSLLGELAANKPAAVIVAVDSCFSGTSTRGEFRPRGGPWKGAETKAPPAGKVDDSFGDFVAGGKPRGGNDNRQYVFLSAASPQQSAAETWVELPEQPAENGERSSKPSTLRAKRQKAYGIFSYALAKALETSGKNTTYRDLFEKLTDYVTSKKRDQTPQIEGSQIDNTIFGEGALTPQNYVAVKLSPNGRPYLLAGKLQGMTPGSKFALYPAGAKNHEDGKQLAIAEIDELNATTAGLRIAGDVAPERLKEAARAFEISHNYEEVLRVAVQEKGLAALVENLGLARLTSPDDKTWNVLIRPPNADDVKFKEIAGDFRGLVLQRPDGSLIAKATDNAKTSEIVRNALLKEAKWLTIKSLEDYPAPELSVVKLEIVPVEVEQNEQKEAVKITESPNELPRRGGKTEIRIESFIRLKIHNTGSKDVFVTVLNLDSTGTISPAFPIGDKDNLIKAGSIFTVQYPFKVTGPCGQESFRAIVTAEPTDFTPLFDSAPTGFESRGARNAFNSPLGKLLRMAQTGRRSEVGTVPASWSTATATFFVVPANGNCEPGNRAISDK